MFSVPPRRVIVVQGGGMARSGDNLEALIEVITSRVMEKLADHVSLPFKPAAETGESCEDCNSCGHCVVNQPETIQRFLDSGADRIGSMAGLTDSPKINGLAGKIDHTLLKPDASYDELIKICDEAIKYKFATVCVNSSNIPLVANRLKGTPVKPIAVVGFPLGAASCKAKAFEAKEAIAAGAREIDMVINIGALKSRDYCLVHDDIRAVVNASAPHKVKVIIETSMLNDEEKVSACTLAKAACASFVKTSTGFGKGGATIEDIQLMRRVVGAGMEVKASGGIRTQADAKKMIEAGADRIGASASIAIVTGDEKPPGDY